MNTNFSHLACVSSASQGRRYDQSSSPHRNQFQRDHDRIIHARAFRKLQHKTQVFVSHEGDFHRTRLTHSLEVAQVTRTICRALSLEENLGVTIALAHDLGHPPFGHTGEDALNDCLKERSAGSFDHNLQALRIVCELESPYPEHKGLNLSFETLDGLAKHNGPIQSETSIKNIRKVLDADVYPLDQQPCLEAQIAGLCDDIAYNCHDLDDGLRADLLNLEDLSAIDQLNTWVQDFRQQWPRAELSQQIYNLHRVMITAMIDDVIKTTANRLNQHQIQTPDQIRNAKGMIASFSPEVEVWLKPLRKFLFHKMYRHESIQIHRDETGQIVKDLFAALLNDPTNLPDDWLQRYTHADEPLEVLVDYISGMTDRYAMVRHQQLFG